MSGTPSVKHCLLMVAAAAIAAGCNVKDPYGGEFPGGGGQTCDTLDCGEHGNCAGDDSGGVACDCDLGWAGDVCDECATGFVADDSGNCVEEASGCADGELTLPNGECAADPCEPDPCSGPNQIAGSCSANTTDLSWTCSCEDGWSGDQCDVSDGTTCADSPCANGTCTDADDGFTCSCDPRWEGELCDQCQPAFTGSMCQDCQPGFFGADCSLSCDSAAALPWPQMDFSSRFSVIAYAPPDQGVDAASIVAVTFDHTALAAAGANPNGDDLRVFDESNAEIPRILAVDSAWDRADTTIWFPLPADLGPGEAATFHVYFGNAAAMQPLFFPGDVLAMSRGWARDPRGNTLYARTNEFATGRSIQIRQLSATEFEVYARDATDSNQSEASVAILDLAGNQLQARQYGQLGTANQPGDARDRLMVSQQAFTVVLTTVDPVESALYFGAEQQYRQAGTWPVQRSYQRNMPATPDPTVGVCPTVTQ